MKDILDNNLQFLDEKYPGMKELILEKREDLLEEEQLEVLVEENLENEEILKVRRNGRTLYLAGKRSAHLSAENQVQALGKIEQSAPIFMIGMGNACYLEEILKATSRENVILLYEPSFSIFYKQIQRLNLKEIFGQHIIALLVGEINDDAGSVTALCQSMLRGNRIPIMKHFILPNYKEICLEQILTFEKLLGNVVSRNVSDLNTTRRFHHVYVDNLFHNADYIRTNYQAVQLDAILPKDIPAIVVSAGPSLNKNIEELKNAENRAFIVAVDTAIKPLISHGIIPDMFVIVDGLKPLDLIEVEESRNIPLLTTSVAAKAVLHYHKGKKFFFNEGITFVNQMYEMNKKAFIPMPSGGSVATLAFSYVSHLGFDRIILVGQDLALTGNKTHADGTFKEKMKEQDTSGYQMVEGNYEEKVPTRPDFDEYRKWFEEYIANWGQKYESFKVINATEGGAKIAGTEVMTLKEAIEQECTKEVDIKRCMDELKPQFDDEEQKKILEYFHDTPKEFKQMADLAADGKHLYEKLEKMTQNGNVDKKAYEKVLKKIKKTTKKIERNVDYQLVEESLSVADQILKSAQYAGYQSFDEECQGIADRGKKFMGLIQECAQMLAEFAETTLGTVLD